MKPFTQKHEIENNLTGEVKNFSIDQSSHVFDILSSKFYDKPLESCVRELLVNARDANIEAGRGDVPIEISLPGEALIIKDSGPGISPDRFENIFLYYGRSSKHDDSNQHGCFGLGAKSPWAVTSQFLITTVHDGVKYVYNLFKNSAGIPSSTLLSQTSSSERSGTQIKIPSLDRHNIRAAVTKNTKYWPVKPKILGDLNFGKDDTKEIVLAGTNWAIFKPSDCNIIYDGIPYLTSFDIPSSVTLIFDKVDLEINPNRESFRVTEHNKKIVRKHVDLFHKEITKHIEDEICKKEFNEAVKLLQNLPTSYMNQDVVWKNGGRKYTFKKDWFTGYDYNKRLEVKKGTSGRLNFFVENYGRAAFFDPNSWIKLSDYSKIRINNYDFSGVSNKDRSAIRQLMKDRNVSRLCVIHEKSDIQLPDFVEKDVVCLADVKVVREKKNTPKKPISIQFYQYNSKSYYSGWSWIMSDFAPEIIYSVQKDKNDGIVRGQIAGKTIGTIKKKQLKRVKDLKNWIPLDDFVKNEIYKKVDSKEASLALGYSKLIDCYPDGILKKLNIEGGHEYDKLHSDESLWEMVIFLEKNSYVKAKKIVDDIYLKYPLFQVLSLGSVDKKNILYVLDYIDYINSKQLRKTA